MQTLKITPELVQSLSYYSSCKLADYLGVVNPKLVNVVGFITLDNFGNFLSVNASVEQVSQN